MYRNTCRILRTDHSAVSDLRSLCRVPSWTESEYRESMDTNPNRKKGIPYWRALVVGILIPLIGVNLYPIFVLWTDGLYNTWIPLKGPPSGAAQIIIFPMKWLGKIWVKANNGTYYSAKLLCNQASSDDALNMCDPRFTPPDWKPEEKISQTPGEKILRGSNCSSLKKGIFPFNPAGPIRECFYTYLHGDFGGDLYIALMADGTLKFWESVEDSYWRGWVVTSIVLSVIFAVIISLLYLIESILADSAKKSESATS